MPQGLQQYSDTGILQFDSESETAGLQRTGVRATQTSGFAMEASMLVIPNVSETDFVVLNAPDGYGAAVNPQGVAANSRVFITNAPVGTNFNYYIFKRSSVVPAGSYGFEVYTLSGLLTFSSRHRFMSSPGFVPDNFSNPYTKSGSKLGFCLLGYGGLKQYSNIEPDSGGYFYDHLWLNTGCVVNNAQQTVQREYITTDNGRYFTSDPGFDFNNIYDSPCKIMIVDVTGIPIGQTFF